MEEDFEQVEGVAEVRLYGGMMDAVSPSPSSAPIWWPLNSGDRVGSWARTQLMSASRSLHWCSGRVRKAVATIVNLQGWLTPHPQSTDAAWNAEARRVWKARTGRAGAFDRAGVLDFVGAQLWMEKCRVIDGDVLLVCMLEQGMAQYAFYRGSQILSVRKDRRGRVLSYELSDDEGKTRSLPAASAYLYRHDPDPLASRGTAELVAAIASARDLGEIVGFIKSSLKITSQLALIETKKEGDKRGGSASRFAKPPASGDAESRAEITLGDSVVASLGEGRDVKVLSDNRPSPDARAMLDFLVADLAYAAELSPMVVFDSGKLSSAAARFELEKLGRWCLKKKQWRQALCDRIWLHTMAAEIAAGRLRMPSDGAWDAVEWVSLRDMTLDLGRVATAAINLAREGMASREDFVMSACGRTQEDLFEEAARSKAAQFAVEEKYGLPRGSLTQGALGAQVSQVEQADSLAPQKQKTEKKNNE